MKIQERPHQLTNQNRMYTVSPVLFPGNKCYCISQIKTQEKGTLQTFVYICMYLQTLHVLSVLVVLID